METAAKICFIGYGKLTEMARKVMERPEFAGEDLVLADAKVDSLHTCIDNAIVQGCEVFIAGSANAAEFRRYSGAMLIEIKLRSIDYAVAIRKVLKLGKRPAVVLYRYSKVIRPEELSPLFDDPIEYIEYQSNEELLEKLKVSNAEAIIGASHANEAAEQFGKTGVLIYPGEEMVVDSFRRARSVVQMLQKERRNNEFVRAIISESRTGIVGFSEHREVLIVNAAAKRLTGMSAGQLRNSRLRQLLPDAEFQRLVSEDRKSGFLVKRTGGQALKLQLMKMENNGRNLGALLLIEGLAGEEDAGDAPQIIPFTGLQTFRDIVCNSPAMKKTIAQAKRYGENPAAPLAITGEYGTGKELLSQSIHSQFGEGSGDYTVVNCAAIRDSEAARFFYGGHAEDDTEGRVVDLSTVGTLVLENIWEAGGKLQACIAWMVKGKPDSVFTSRDGKLLKFRVITIVPSDKRQLCEETVRPDLLNSLRAYVLEVPPLRERREDIAGIFSRYFGGAADFIRTGSDVIGSLLPILTGYSWPGNCYELRNVCQRYALETASAGKLSVVGRKRCLINCIGERRIFEDIVRQLGFSGCANDLEGEQLALLVDRLKACLLYNNEQIADKLGISRTSIWRKIQQNNA